jgi:hypothetical protein
MVTVISAIGCALQVVGSFGQALQSLNTPEVWTQGICQITRRYEVVRQIAQSSAKRDYLTLRITIRYSYNRSPKPVVAGSSPAAPASDVVDLR